MIRLKVSRKKTRYRRYTYYINCPPFKWVYEDFEFNFEFKFKVQMNFRNQEIETGPLDRPLKTRVLIQEIKRGKSTKKHFFFFKTPRMKKCAQKFTSVEEFCAFG